MWALCKADIARCTACPIYNSKQTLCTNPICIHCQVQLQDTLLPPNRLHCPTYKCFKSVQSYPFTISRFRRSSCQFCQERKAHKKTTKRTTNRATKESKATKARATNVPRATNKPTNQYYSSCNQKKPLSIFTGTDSQFLTYTPYRQRNTKTQRTRIETREAYNKRIQQEAYNRCIQRETIKRKAIKRHLQV